MCSGVGGGGGGGEGGGAGDDGGGCGSEVGREVWRQVGMGWVGGETHGAIVVLKVVAVLEVRREGVALWPWRWQVGR